MGRDAYFAVDSREVFHHRAKNITAHTPKPYGAIPRRRKSRPQKKQQRQQHHAPYPYFEGDQSMNSASLLTLLFQRLFYSSKDDSPPSSPVGFMPRSLTVPDVATSPLDVTAPASAAVPIAIRATTSDEDGCSCLSSSSSSCGSLSSSTSSCSSCSSLSTTLYMSEEQQLVVPPSDCSSTAALSDLLCDHYVQSQTEDDMKDVPLETFRMFEAPSPDDDERWCLWESPKHWTPIESKQPYEEKKSLPREQAAPPKDHCRVRDLRANSAHLRMIVVEANMMRAQKIVGPLRPRGYLPKRLDPFVSNTPSSLRYPQK